MYKSGLWQNIVGSLLQRRLAQTLLWRDVTLAVSPLVLVHPPVSLTARREGAIEDDISDVLQSIISLTSRSSVVHIGILLHFKINEEASLPIGLCLIWLKSIISSLGSGLCCSIIFTSSILTLTIPKHISCMSPSCQVPIYSFSTTPSTIANTALTEVILTMCFLLNIANKSK